MPIKLSGKDYVTVNERVEAALATEASYQMVSAETFTILDRWFYRATLLVGERQYIGTAEIKFGAPGNTADGKNPIECAETSAVGRALGFAGFGVVDGIASADEMLRGESQRTTEHHDRRTTAAAPGSPEAKANAEAYADNAVMRGEVARLANELGVSRDELAALGKQHNSDLLAVYNELRTRAEAARQVRQSAQAAEEPSAPEPVLEPEGAPASPGEPGEPGATEKQLASIGHLCQFLEWPVPEVRSYGHAVALLKSLNNEAQARRRKEQQAS